MNPPSLLTRYRHIVIEGPIGVGKSTLARHLADHLGAAVLLERPQDNPFLERFYAEGAREPNRYAFQTQLFFLFQRLEQLRETTQPGMFSPGIVSDFLFDKDAIFARLTLSDDEYALYRQIHAGLAPQVPSPDLVVWLQAEPASLLARIRQRGIAMERDIDEAYLRRLCDAYLAHFHAYDDAPVLAINTERFHPADRPADFALLLDKLAEFRGRRGFLNPQIDDGAAAIA